MQVRVRSLFFRWFGGLWQIETGFFAPLAVPHALAHDRIAAFLTNEPAAFTGLNATGTNDIGQRAIFGNYPSRRGANCGTILAGAEYFEKILSPLDKHIRAMSHAQFTTAGTVTAILGNCQKNWHFRVNTVR